mmetsp:Transcript_56038/g.111245  ORF Transcript_56038/g.111245 Transcript_56038/m.111245 type:complete len:226 (+) Transcript_56038:123-800(+)
MLCLGALSTLLEKQQPRRADKDGTARQQRWSHSCLRALRHGVALAFLGLENIPFDAVLLWRRVLLLLRRTPSVPVVFLLERGDLEEHVLVQLELRCLHDVQDRVGDLAHVAVRVRLTSLEEAHRLLFAVGRLQRLRKVDGILPSLAPSEPPWRLGSGSREGGHRLLVFTALHEQDPCVEQDLILFPGLCSGELLPRHILVKAGTKHAHLVVERCHFDICSHGSLA